MVVYLSLGNRSTIVSMAKKKNPAAVALGRKGGKARAKNLSASELHDIAMKGVEGRRKKRKQKAR